MWESYNTSNPSPPGLALKGHKLFLKKTIGVQGEEVGIKLYPLNN